MIEVVGMVYSCKKTANTKELDWKVRHSDIMWLLFASASAVCFGLRGISYQWVSRKPVDRNLLLFGVYLCGTVVALAAAIVFAQSWTRGSLLGLLMGVFSFTSNAAMYKGFSVGKASLVAVFTALPPVVVTIVAFLLWRETFHAAQGVAFLLIVGGVVLIRFGGLHSVRDLHGIVWAVIALFGFGFTDVSTKAATRLGGETFPTLATMYAVGALLFLASWRLMAKPTAPAAATEADVEGTLSHSGHNQPTEGSALRDSEHVQTPAAPSPLRTFALGLAIGTTNITGMILILSAFRVGITGLVSAVVAMNVVLILLYARVVLKESFSHKEWTGIALAICGILVLKLLG